MAKNEGIYRRPQWKTADDIKKSAIVSVIQLPIDGLELKISQRQIKRIWFTEYIGFVFKSQSRGLLCF